MRQSAFTLIEIVAAIAIGAIIAAIALPTAMSAHRSATIARTKIQWAQWERGVDGFRLEYGTNPQFHASNKVNGGAGPLASEAHLFHDLLAGRRRDGASLGDADPAAIQNSQRLRLLQFTQHDFADSDAGVGVLLCDAFGNTDIAVVVDRNADGFVDPSDGPGFPSVSPPGSPAIHLQPGPSEIGPGVRAHVIFYSAPPGAVSASQLIMSWR